MITPKNAFKVKFENNQCSQKEIGARYIEMAINDLISYNLLRGTFVHPRFLVFVSFVNNSNNGGFR